MTWTIIRMCLRKNNFFFFDDLLPHVVGKRACGNGRCRYLIRRPTFRKHGYGQTGKSFRANPPSKVGGHQAFYSSRLYGVGPETCARLHAKFGEIWRRLANPQWNIHQNFPHVGKSSAKFSSATWAEEKPAKKSLEVARWTLLNSRGVLHFFVRGSTSSCLCAPCFV